MAVLVIVVDADTEAVLVAVDETVAATLHVVASPLAYMPMARLRMPAVLPQPPGCLMIPNSVHPTVAELRW